MKKLLLVLLAVGLFSGLSATDGDLRSAYFSDVYKNLLIVKNSAKLGVDAGLEKLTDGYGNESKVLIAAGASQTDEIAFSLDTKYKFSWRDNGLVMYSSADGQLDIDADTELELGIGKFDVNASDAITIDCSDNTKSIALGETSGLAITIGHTTSETTVSDNLTVTGDQTVGGTLGITGKTTTTALQSVGEINLDATTLDIDASDDIDIDTSDTTGGIAIGTVTSGVPISIGHTTSETTVNDNLTITGTTTLAATTLGAKLTAGANEIECTNVDIGGGDIDATVIGDDTPAAGSFTTIETTSTTKIGDTVAMGGNKLDLDLDADTSITSDTDDQIDFEVGGNDELKLTAAALYPSSDGGLDLGIDASTEWNDIYLLGDVDCEDDLVVGDDASVGGNLTITGKVTVADDTDSNGNTLSSGLFAHDGTPQSLSGADAINATTAVTLFTSTGANNITIANGTISGQMKYVVHIVDGGTGTFTGANWLATGIVLTDAGDSVTLMWITSISKWAVVGEAGDVFTP